MKRWILTAFGVFAALITVVILFGLTRPAAHTAHTEALYPVAPAVLWDSLTHFESWPEWYPEIEGVRRLPDRGGHAVIELTSSWGTVPTDIVVFEPPARLRTSLDAGSFRGSWTYVLTPTGGGTLLRVTEQGEVDNPVVRTLMVFMDEHATMRAFHRALAHRLGVAVRPAQIVGVAHGRTD